MVVLSVGPCCRETAVVKDEINSLKVYLVLWLLCQFMFLQPLFAMRDFFCVGKGWTNRNTFTIFHINLLVKTRPLLHDLHAWTQNPSPGPAIFRFKSFKQAQVFISSSIFPKLVSLKALGQQRNSAEHKDVFVTTSTQPKADQLQQTLQIASPPGVVPLEPPISASPQLIAKLPLSAL